MKCPAILFALFLAACNAAPTAILPPPFGPDSSAPGPARLFFPTGMAVTAAGNLLVANGNFDHAYDAGTIVSISGSYLQAFFDRNKAVRCDKIASSATCDEQIPISAFIDAALIGNYAGPLVIDPAGTTAYTGSRDTNRLNGISLLPDGHVYCRNGSATDRCACRGPCAVKGSCAVKGPCAGRSWAGWERRATRLRIGPKIGLENRSARVGHGHRDGRPGAAQSHVYRPLETLGYRRSGGQAHEQPGR